MPKSLFTTKAFTTKACVLLVAACSLTGLCSCNTTRPAADMDGLAQVDQRRVEARQAFESGEQARVAGRMDVAKAEYRRATLLDPTLAEAWNNLGVALLDEGTFLDAADAFRRALNAAAPEDPRPARNLGYTYAQAGWAEEALKHYETALERSPNDLESIRGAVRVTKELNLADTKALERVRRALLLDRDEQWRSIYFSEESRLKERLEAERQQAIGRSR
jgi:tetratricopeptide (TPR) repeat protein